MRKKKAVMFSARYRKGVGNSAGWTLRLGKDDQGFTVKRRKAASHQLNG